ncbi:MAG: CpsD/CapB family tyrosine-protein kinase, partial [Bacteroidales bacterium]|nr:CpsD/CapB family tyrosine-protein kinase [Bacteroidales bacterium]
RKTLLLGFDLRKPTVHKAFQIKNMLGISSYLINKANLQDIISRTNIPNLDLIPTGEIPPNPVELIVSQKTDEMMEQLKSMYSYIIIDTPPIGVVSDALLLMKYTDVNLYVVRQGFTSKRQLGQSIADLKEKEIKNFAVIMNDVKKVDGAKSKGYDSGYGYYAEPPRKKGMLSFFKGTRI